MEQNQLIDTTIPLWGILVLVITSLGAGIWNAVKFYFRNEGNTKKFREQKEEMNLLRTRIEVIKTETNSAIEKHKEDTNREFSRLNTKLDNQGTTLTEVKTMVRLLIDDKIKN